MHEHTPVLIGVGTWTDRAQEPSACMSPLALLRAASERAADDAGLARARLWSWT